MSQKLKNARKMLRNLKNKNFILNSLIYEINFVRKKHYFRTFRKTFNLHSGYYDM